MYLCPYCGEEINQASELCPHCGSDLTQLAEAAEPAPPRSLRRILLIWAVIITGIAGMLWGFLWFVLPEQRGSASQRAQAGALAAVRDLQEALASYAQAQPDHAFPQSLEALGDRARADAQLAQSNGYQLSYEPANPGPDGAVRGYALTARAGNYGYLNFYLDEAGPLRVTRENRAANSHDPPL
jgi:zinc-ribbon domain